MSLSTSIRCWIADIDAPEPDPTFAVWMRAAEALESENARLREALRLACESSVIDGDPPPREHVEGACYWEEQARKALEVK